MTIIIIIIIIKLSKTSVFPGFIIKWSKPRVFFVLYYYMEQTEGISCALLLNGANRGYFLCFIIKWSKPRVFLVLYY